MGKHLIPWIILAAVAIAGAYYLGSEKNEKEIARVKQQVQGMKQQRDSIKTLVALKDSLQNILQKRVAELETDAGHLREQVKALEELRKEKQLNVRRLKTPDDLKNKFAKTFPELPEDKIKLFEEYIPAADLSVKYFGVPLWFSETFIIDHQNSLSYKQQKDKLQDLDSLNVQVIALNKQVLVLEKEKSEAYKVGYDSAYANYMSISKLYIKELEKPRFDWTHWGAIIGGTAAGVLLGTQIK